MPALDFITTDLEIRSGKPWVKGTRIIVVDVLKCLAGGMSEDEIVDDFPKLTRDAIRACLAIAAEREKRVLTVDAK
jgi:uncharacterized protein (DUF433 family)